MLGPSIHLFRSRCIQIRKHSNKSPNSQTAKQPNKQTERKRDAEVYNNKQVSRRSHNIIHKCTKAVFWRIFVVYTQKI